MLLLPNKFCRFFGSGDHGTYGCFLKWWVSPHYTPQVLIIFSRNTQWLLGKPSILGKPPSRWWFQIFFIFTPTWTHDPIWRAYFSKGLVQPPTNHIYLYIYIPGTYLSSIFGLKNLPKQGLNSNQRVCKSCKLDSWLFGTSKASLQFGKWDFHGWDGFWWFPTVPYETIWNHPVETTMYEWIGQVPGRT